MTSEERDQLVSAIEAALVQASGTTTENVYAFFARAEPWARNMAELLGRVQSRESLIAFLDFVPAELEPLIPLAVSTIPLLPAMAVKEMKEALQPAARAFAAGSAGRPNAIPEAIKPQIIEFISRVEKLGGKRRVAQQRAAQHFGLTLRSVQRVWRHRGRYSPGRAASISELIANFDSLVDFQITTRG